MIGEKLKALRNSKGLTIVQLCTELEMNSNTYAKYERNERDVSTDTLVKLADYYSVPADYLLGRVPAEAELLTEAETELERRLLEQYHKLPEKYRKQYLEGVRQAVEMQKQEEGSLGPMTHSATIGELLEAAKSESEAKKGA